MKLTPNEFHWSNDFGIAQPSLLNIAIDAELHLSDKLIAITITAVK